MGSRFLQLNSTCEVSSAACEAAPAASCDPQLFDGWPSSPSEAKPANSSGLGSDPGSVLSNQIHQGVRLISGFSSFLWKSEG